MLNFFPQPVFAPETLSADRASVQPYGHGLAGTLKVAYGKYAVAANVEDGDIFEMCKVPRNCLVVGGVFYTADLDTGTEVLDMDVGWAANGGGAATFTDKNGTVWTNSGANASAAGFVNSGVLTGDAGGAVAVGNARLFSMQDGPWYFSEETSVQVEANVAANAFAAGNIVVVIHYILL